VVLCHGLLVGGPDEIKLPRFGSAGSGNVVRVVFELGGPVDRRFAVAASICAASIWWS